MKLAKRAFIVLKKNIDKKTKRGGDTSKLEKFKAIQGLVGEYKSGATASCYSMNAEGGKNDRYLSLDKCISPNVKTEDDGDTTCTWSNKCSDTITAKFNGTQVDIQTRKTDDSGGTTNLIECLQTGTYSETTYNHQQNKQVETGNKKKKFIKPKCDTNEITAPKLSKKT